MLLNEQIIINISKPEKNMFTKKSFKIFALSLFINNFARKGAKARVHVQSSVLFVYIIITDIFF